MTKKLDEYTKEELLATVKSLKKRLKFGLVWEEKPEDVVKQCQDNLPVLDEVVDRAIISDQKFGTHVIIEGDNYHSLSALSYTHAGKVDLIYIDPPYNTGNKDFIYNDHYVDREDSFRHSKWLSFMSKRLKLAKDLLKTSGVIFISIDNNEYAHLKLLCDQIFDEKNFVGNLIWRKKEGGGQADAHFVTEHEYVIVYSKSDEYKWQDEIIPVGEAKFNKSDDIGKYTAVKLAKWGNTARREDRPKMYFPVVAPDGKKVYPVAPDGNDGRWRVGKKRMEMLVAAGLVEWKEKDGKWLAYEKIYYSDEDVKKVKERSILYELATTADGTKELTKIFGTKDVFENPKPTDLINFCLEYGAGKDALVLDFFAGSGTTAHSVLKMNARDSGSRRVILCTDNQSGIAENITYERIKKVVQGYGDTPGIPANVRYFKTEFVSKEKTDDQTRLALIERCTDMIRVREDTYEAVINETDLKVFTSSDHISAIIFNPQEIESGIKKMESLENGKPANLYIFSYSNYAYEEDIPETTLQYTIRPIPESILEVYRRIFKEDMNV